MNDILKKTIKVGDKREEAFVLSSLLDAVNMWSIEFQLLQFDFH